MFPHVAKLSEALELLGLNEDCTLGELKGAYKEHALRTHPDKNPRNPDATAEFQRVGEAYKVIEARLKRSRFSTGSLDPFFADIHAEDVDGLSYECSDSGEYEYDYSDDSDSDSDYAYHRLPRHFTDYLFLFEAINGGYYRCNCPWYREESAQEYQARLKRSGEEQVAAENRRTAEAAARKERKTKKQERERADAERRKKAKAEHKKAQAEVRRQQTEEAINAQQRRTQDRRSVVFAAARSGNAERVKEGIWKDDVDAAGGEIKYEKFTENVPDDPLETLLHIVAKKGDVELFQWLDAHNAEMDERNSRGYTALHFAIYHGRLSVVRYIFENYPPKEPEHKHIYDPPACSNLIHLAVQSGKPELVWMVLENGLFNAQDIKSGLSWVNQASDVKQKANDSKLQVEIRRDILRLLMRSGDFAPSLASAVVQAAGQEYQSLAKEKTWKEERSTGQTTTFGQHRGDGKRERFSQFNRGHGRGSARRGRRSRGRPWQTSS